MRLLISALAILSTLAARAQLNATLAGRLEYDQELNDIWGYVAPDGTEYALVGTTRGLSIVSLADPSHPEEVVFVSGSSSIWRDIKTYKDFAYITLDQSRTKDGLVVIDLRGLPDQVSSSHWRPAPNGTDTLNRCHNLYIDENGVAYLAGCNLNNGGILMADVATTPGQPRFIGFGSPVYAHDVFVQNGRMYASELYDGRLAIYDVSDKNNVRPLTKFNTPYRFTHNAWASSEGNYVFTTDERSNAPVTAFDISDLDNVSQTDQYRPLETLGTGVIPHNVHVLENWLAISYYTDGARFVDASRPGNLIEVANFDTFDEPRTGFHGAWGLYPFLPSGLQLVSDIENGLFVIDVNLVRAAYLEGIVTELGSNIPISDVEIEIAAAPSNLTTSDRNGSYKTGLGLSGSFNVTFRHPEYEDKTVLVDLGAGEVTRLDIQLKSIAPVTINGQVLDRATYAPIPNAAVLAVNGNFSFQVQADANGRFQMGQVVQESYDLFAGAWGYRHKKLSNVPFSSDASLTILLEKGYQDDFIFDLGWTSSGDALTGHWERGVPDGVRFDGVFTSPPFDIPGDFGAPCYVTGNGGGNPGEFDVDQGTVTLTSPLFDLSGYEAPIVSYYLWFYDRNGATAPDDELRVFITNGPDTILLESISDSDFQWRPKSEFSLADRIDLSSAMRLIVQTSDEAATDHIVEAGIDAFFIREGETTAVDDPLAASVQLHAFPNPFHDQIHIDYQLPASASRAFLRVFNTLGQELERSPLKTSAGTIELGQRLPGGVYYIFLEIDGQRGPVRKVVKGG
jgi:choice-of-anchor B domain-containing protein